MSENEVGFEKSDEVSAASGASNKIEEVILEDLVEEGACKSINLNPLELVKNVKVSLSVELGKATLTVDELTHLKEQSVVKMDKLVDEPIDLLLDGKTVARGKLVAVGDVFGVQITEIQSQ
ncbi:flagellar motor switch protein [Hahella sp. CCB-MM4]|uniref:FliM/FliN family flagellar motor switch protein n=1 Tax=Hahella sp. (strain CCB-MM4) TaxID=1926491 RepID=UPI000B9B3899|nr:FliM/FliN family flagellar motor switch protein [Hahella sp. CCB-MM4]OZG74837.1 flagellar motor switch protein [Hahella sp. CCB-MM4]